MMTYCIGLSDTAMHVAGEKLKGTSVEEARKFYTSKPSSQINLATVDKVYSEKITSVWEYSVSFFNECANNIGKSASIARRIGPQEYRSGKAFLARIVL